MTSCLTAVTSCAWEAWNGAAQGMGFPVKPQDPVVHFSQTQKADKVVVEKFVVSGTGKVLAEAPLLQTRAYFEAEVLEAGTFAVGVSYPNTTQQEGHVGDGETSWGILSVDLSCNVKEGDIIGCAYDMSDLWPRLMFFVNGDIIQNREIKAIRGEVYPAVSVEEGSKLELNFGHREFVKGPPPRFEGVIPTRDIMNASA